jgi:hypothetical protein
MSGVDYKLDTTFTMLCYAIVIVLFLGIFEIYLIWRNYRFLIDHLYTEYSNHFKVALKLILRIFMNCFQMHVSRNDSNNTHIDYFLQSFSKKCLNFLSGTL